jgi:hypothetical protein
MNFQKMILLQTMLMGLAGALLFVNSVYAQQDMDPAFFDDTPGTPQGQQAAVVPAGQGVQAPDASSADTAAPLAGQSVGASALTPLDENIAIFLMVAFGSVVLLAMVEDLRGSRRRTSRGRYPKRFPSGATAN